MMTKRIKALSLASVFLLMAVLAVLSSVCVGAVQSDTKVYYTNSDTNYRVMIQDDANLISESEMTELVNSMKPLTAYCDVRFLSSRDYDSDELDENDTKLKDILKPGDYFLFFESEKNNKISIMTDGTVDKKLTQKDYEDIFKGSDDDYKKGGELGYAQGMYQRALTAMGGELPLPREPGVEPYKNPETGYSALIYDDAELLSFAEKELLMHDMKPLTKYGNVAYWTTNETASNELDQAMNKRRALFGDTSSTVFVINMKIRKLTIQSDGGIYDVITDSRARSITDNVKGDTRNKKYYAASNDAFGQMLTLLEGGTISEPMKIASYVMLSLLAGLIIALAIIFSKRCNPLAEESRQFTDEIKENDSCCKKVKQYCDSEFDLGLVPRAGLFILQLMPDILLGAIGGGGGSGGGSGGGGGGGGGSSSF